MRWWNPLKVIGTYVANWPGIKDSFPKCPSPNGHTLQEVKFLVRVSGQHLMKNAPDSSDHANIRLKNLNDVRILSQPAKSCASNHLRGTLMVTKSYR